MSLSVPPAAAGGTDRECLPSIKAGANLKLMNRPPPYFPQNQLSPPDEKRYKKFKFVVALSIFVLTLILIGIGVGLYYLIRSFF